MEEQRMLKNTGLQIIFQTNFLPPTLHSIVTNVNIESFLPNLKPHTKVHKLEGAKGVIKMK